MGLSINTSPSCGVVMGRNRITSYNVCYTKLLRSHVQNFFNAIRGKEKQNSTIDDGVKSTLLCHLTNIAYRTGEVLICNPTNGHITNSDKAMKLWKREYEKGWAPNF